MVNGEEEEEEAVDLVNALDISFTLSPSPSPSLQRSCCGKTFRRNLHKYPVEYRIGFMADI